MNRIRLGWMILGGIAICAALGALEWGVPFDVIYQLTLGWILYLIRVVPQIRLDLTGVVTAAFCLTGVLVGLHAFAGWIAAHNRGASGPRWEWRSTLTLVGVIVLAFVAGIAAVGVVHQTGWLMSSPAPVFEDRVSRGTWAQRNAAQKEASNQLHWMGLGSITMWEQRGVYPPGTLFDSQGRMMHSWQTRLLPYLEHDNVYKRIRLDSPWDHPTNAQAMGLWVETYVHPVHGYTKDDQGRCLTGFAGNVRLLGSDVPIDYRRLSESKGTANLILAGEAPANYRPWGDPMNLRDPAHGLNQSPDGFGSPLGGRTLIVFADGSVRSFSDKADPEFIRLLSLPDPRR
jgi:Protein of unknown function (DUF1559)